MTESTKRKTNGQLSIVSFNNGTYSATLTTPEKTVKLPECTWDEAQRLASDVKPKLKKLVGWPDPHSPSLLGSVFTNWSEPSAHVDDLAVPTRVGSERDLVMDVDVKRVAEFIQENLQCDKMVAVAEAVARLAPILWGRYERVDVDALSLQSKPIGRA